MRLSFEISVHITVGSGDAAARNLLELDWEPSDADSTGRKQAKARSDPNEKLIHSAFPSSQPARLPAKAIKVAPGVPQGWKRRGRNRSDNEETLALKVRLPKKGDYSAVIASLQQTSSLVIPTSLPASYSVTHESDTLTGMEMRQEVGVLLGSEIDGDNRV